METGKESAIIPVSFEAISVKLRPVVQQIFSESASFINSTFKFTTRLIVFYNIFRKVILYQIKLLIINVIIAMMN